MKKTDIIVFDKKDGNWVCNYKTELNLHENNIMSNEGDVFGFGSLLITVRDKDNLIIAKKVLTAATVFKTKPSDIEETKDGDCILRYNIGDIFMVGSAPVADSINIELLFKMLLSGKVNTKVPRTDYFNIIKNNIEMNEPLDVSERMLEFLIAILQRNKSNPDIPARLKPDDPYIFLPYRAMVARQSTFSALVHEDPKTMLAISLARKNSTNVEKSPLEKYSKL